MTTQANKDTIVAAATNLLALVNALSVDGSTDTPPVVVPPVSVPPVTPPAVNPRGGNVTNINIPWNTGQTWPTNKTVGLGPKDVVILALHTGNEICSPNSSAGQFTLWTGGSGQPTPADMTLSLVPGDFDSKLLTSTRFEIGATKKNKNDVLLAPNSVYYLNVRLTDPASAATTVSYSLYKPTQLVSQ